MRRSASEPGGKKLPLNRLLVWATKSGGHADCNDHMRCQPDGEVTSARDNGQQVLAIHGDDYHTLGLYRTSRSEITRILEYMRFGNRP
jgi:hypothetical protein